MIPDIGISHRIASRSSWLWRHRTPAPEHPKPDPEGVRISATSRIWSPGVPRRPTSTCPARPHRGNGDPPWSSFMVEVGRGVTRGPRGDQHRDQPGTLWLCGYEH